MVRAYSFDLLRLILLVVFVAASQFNPEDFRDREIDSYAENLKGNALIRYVNHEQDLWTARRHARFDGYSEASKSRLMGVKHLRVPASAPLSPTRFLSIDIPESFDAREQWPNCGSIGAIRDQSSCGSCWAFGATEAMSDRICIATNATIQVNLSAEDLLSCCKSCGNGCDGGHSIKAWQYWVSDGIVSGGGFASQVGCKPYPFAPCGHHSNKTHYDPCKSKRPPTPKCEKMCDSKYEAHSYDEDKLFGQSAYRVINNAEAIQKEILIHGPVEASFAVYEDFWNYASGVYVHVAGKLLGAHAVKLIGWGMEGDVPYWLIVNSFNTDWGENGLFRMLRGTDECWIELNVVGGVPKIEKTRRKNSSGDVD